MKYSKFGREREKRERFQIMERQNEKKERFKLWIEREKKRNIPNYG